MRGPTGARFARLDWAIAVALGAAVAAYLLAGPRSLSHSDEAHFLYHAKRVLEGAVPYRDFFDLYTPLAYYGMALAFALFGTQLLTAKVVAALVHAATAGLVYAAGRALGVRRIFGVTGALLFLAICHPAWPYASPHWVATMLLVATLLLLVRRPRERWALVLLGTAVGALFSMQHQTGAPVALGVALALAADHALERRDAGGRGLAASLAWAALPAGAVVAATLLSVLLRSGPGPIFEQLVVHPFTGYANAVGTSWGEIPFLARPLAEQTAPRLLAALPPVLLASCALRLAGALRAGERASLGPLADATLLAAAAAVSVLYNPDFVHLAFIAPVFLVIGMETAEWALGRRPLAATPPALAGALAAALALACAAQLYVVGERAHARYGHSRATAFGRIDFGSAADARFYEQVRDELASSPTRELFCYPVFTSLYLATGAHNPTRHVLMLPRYLEEKEYEETIAILEARKVRNVVMGDALIDRETDPMYAYVRANYECVDSRCRLYRRRD